MKRLKQASTDSCTSGSKAQRSSRLATVPHSAHFTVGVSKWPQARRHRRCATCRWWRRSEPAEKDAGATEMKRPATFPPPAVRSKFAATILLDAAEIGGEGQLGDEGRAAPIRGQPTRVQVGDAPLVECRGVIADKHVALGLGEVGVIVPEVKRKRLVGEAYAGVPGPVALV